MDWTKTGWTKKNWMKSRSTASDRHKVREAPHLFTQMSYVSDRQVGKLGNA